MMLKKVWNKVKKVMRDFRETAMVVVSAVAFSYMNRPLPVCASAGVIIVIYGAIRFAITFQKMDQNGEHQAIYTIISGGVLIGISAVLAVMGV